MPIPVHDIAFKVVSDSLEPSFFDDEVMFVMKDTILRTGDISIVQINSGYFVMKVSQNRENGDILFNSINSIEAPFTLLEKDDFSIFDKVVLL
ncbi:S24 family peptidase [uncultured Streptococcus sp.]|uniref:S24 family peptidase n=1 Tax=uncultured Streptococcus sp. TaxID=83427 RepID=UPI002675547F|nr:S24 family peptidase [uncultured Streptococcus sp.]